MAWPNIGHSHNSYFQHPHSRPTRLDVRPWPRAVHGPIEAPPPPGFAVTEEGRAYRVFSPAMLGNAHSASPVN